MSKRPRTAHVFVPELDRKVIVRGMTDAEMQGDGRDVSTPEKHAQALAEGVQSAVVSPKLTTAQVRALSSESVERICDAQFRLRPETAALLKRAQRAGW